MDLRRFIVDTKGSQVRISKLSCNLAHVVFLSNSADPDKMPTSFAKVHVPIKGF